MKTPMIRILGLLAATVFVASCGQSEDIPEPAEQISAAHYVPADTVVFGGGLEPIPVHDLSATMNAFNVYQSMDWSKPLDEVLRSDSPATRFLAAWYLDYLQNLGQPDALAGRYGIGEELDFAFYTVGLIPVLRYRLSDAAALDALIKDTETKARAPALTSTLGGVNVRRYAFDPAAAAGKKLDLVVAVHDGFAVFTLDSDFIQDDTLKLALGIERPGASLGLTGKLQQIVSDHGFLPNYIAFIDYEQIVRGITSDDANLLARMLSELPAASGGGYDRDMDRLKSEACRSELGAIASRWPRLVFGYTEFQVASKPMVMDGLAIQESTDAEMMVGLRELRGVIPAYALSNDHRPIVDWSLGLNFDALVPFLNRTRKAIVNTKYQCEVLLAMRQSVAQSNPAAMAMVMAFASGIKGIGLSVLDFEMSDSPGPPQIARADAIVTLTAANPTNLYMTASAMLPMLANAPPPTGGQTIDLPLPLPGVSLTPKLTLTDHNIVLFSGEQGAKLAGTLASGSLEANGFISFKLDYKQYFRLLLQGIKSSPQYAELTEQDLEMMRKFEDIDAAMTIAVDFIDKGITMRSRMEVR